MGKNVYLKVSDCITSLNIIITSLIDASDTQTDDIIRSLYIKLYELFYLLAVISPNRYLSSNEHQYLTLRLSDSSWNSSASLENKNPILSDLYRILKLLYQLDKETYMTLLKVI